MKIFVKTAVATCALAMVAGSASAMIIISSGPGNFAGDENVLFNSGLLLDNGPLVQGITNNSGFIVDFYDAGEDLITPSGGQARIEAVNGGYSSLSMNLHGAGSTFKTLIWNLNAIDDGSVTFTVARTGGAAVNKTFALNGPGQNFFRFRAVGEEMTRVSLTSTVEIADAKQIRVGGGEAVPEPATLALLGTGLVALIRRRRIRA